jgi:DNA-binding SARP family transcriptional activator
MFGKLRVQHGNTDLPGFDARKVQELLCYLLLHRRQVHNRERLATLFWDNQTTANSRKYLRHTLWQLQTALDKPMGESEPILLTDDEWIQVNPAAPLWVDVAALEAAFAAVQQIPGAQLTGEQAARLEEAVSVYQADLLDGWFLDWCIFERERLQSMYLGALDKLVSGCEARQEYARGIAHATAILRCDRARERTYRHIMRMHYLAGDRTRALREYETCVVALRDELGVDPARSTVELYAVIRDDRLVAPVQPHMLQPHRVAALGSEATVSGAAVSGAGLGDLLQTLARVQEGINVLNAQVDNCMKAIERLLWS